MRIHLHKAIHFITLKIAFSHVKKSSCSGPKGRKSRPQAELRPDEPKMVGRPIIWQRSSGQVTVRLFISKWRSIVFYRTVLKIYYLSCREDIYERLCNPQASQASGYQHHRLHQGKSSLHIPQHTVKPHCRAALVFSQLVSRSVHVACVRTGR